MKSVSSFTAITSEGGLLPADFLTELLAPKATIEGLEPVSYNLAEGERISEQVNRSWNRLKGRWTDFKKAIADKPEGAPTTTETRDRWLHPFFQELGFGQRLPVTQPIEMDGRSYPISHGYSHVPIHLVGSHLDLDTRTPGAVGAAKASPHSLVQQVLNASERHLWGIVSNGVIFRLIRDNIALTRLSYLEWDLKAIFDGDLYSEFFVLWLVAHQSRFDGERADQCWLEQWKKVAEDKGLRALENLRPGVAQAIEALGAGLVSHPANQTLRTRLSRGELTTQEFYRQVLRLIYRMLFLFVAEDRGLLHPPAPTEDAPKEEVAQAQQARSRYKQFYAITRLRGFTLHRAGTPHPDLWHVFQFVTQKLGSDTGCPELALPALGSFLWESVRSTPDLTGALVTNRHFLSAVHALGFVQDRSVRRAIDYKNLGSEELGSVYEGLLELHPIINPDTAAFELDTASGNERKTSGSYYTPESLVQCLLDSALEPVMAEAVRGKQGQSAANALLTLKICDPAVGSGHFLIAAAHRLAKRVAAARSGEDEPSPKDTRTALRDVIGRCLYGVDLNPMAAELCRVSLWLESLEPGKPLSFLDHHIRVGNSLLGASPELIAPGLPDEAFTAIQGDDKKACAVLKKLNKAERKGLGPLFAQEDAETQARLQQAAAALEELPDDRPEDIRAKELAFRRHEETEEYHQKRQLADMWCAAFVIKKHFREPDRESSASGITQGHLNDLASGRPLPAELVAESERLSGNFLFFQWHLAFPEVFAKGGFDCVLGNPPWERVKLQEKEWFAENSPEIANAPNAAVRKRRIEALTIENPALHKAFEAAVRQAVGEGHIIRFSGRYSLCGQGEINTYSVFAETTLRLVNPRGRVGQVLPSGIVIDQACSAFFTFLMQSKRLLDVKSFENEALIFRDVHHFTKFCLITLGGQDVTTEAARFVFFLRRLEELSDPSRSFTLSFSDMQRISPIVPVCPTFRSEGDAAITRAIYSRVPLFRGGSATSTVGSWDIQYLRMFDMANDSDLFCPASAPGDNALSSVGARLLPLYEGKLIWQFNHRFAGYRTADVDRGHRVLPETPESELCNPTFSVQPFYAIEKRHVIERLQPHWSKSWMFAWRDVTTAVTQRTVVVSALPLVGVGHTAPVLLCKDPDTALAASLLANLNSFVVDYIARQKLGGVHLTFTILDQLPVLARSALERQVLWSNRTEMQVDWLMPRVLELTYSAWDLESFARDCDWFGPPFRWDEERRFLLRCELDAAFFHLYLPSHTTGDWRSADGEKSDELAWLKASFATPRDVVGYIMDTFPIVRRKDEAKFDGDYRTKRAILEIYDAMLESIRTGQPYQTRLDPPPADLRCCHPKRKIGILAFGSLMDDPGCELLPKIVMRIKAQTPFPVEYGRYSVKTRGGAPTLVPHDRGEPVSGEILVLDDAVSVQEATDMLWRRETRRVGSGERYTPGTSPNSVLVDANTNFPWVSTVLYTDFRPEGKIANPMPAELAKHAIQSGALAEEGMDGISYLMNVLASGINTPLTEDYKAEILKQSGTLSLSEALKNAKKRS